MADGFQWNGRNIRDDVEQRIFDQMLAMGRSVISIAQRYAPKRTGRLAMSIHYEADRPELSIAFVVGAPYGMFVEFGTRYMRPQPYLRPALNTVGPIYGYHTEMIFANMPQIHAPIIAAGAGFHLPSTLTKKQLTHVRKHLLPTSKRHHIANVSRAKVRVRRAGP